MADELIQSIFFYYFHKGQKKERDTGLFIKHSRQSPQTLRPNDTHELSNSYHYKTWSLDSQVC